MSRIDEALRRAGRAGADDDAAAASEPPLVPAHEFRAQPDRYAVVVETPPAVRVEESTTLAAAPDLELRDPAEFVVNGKLVISQEIDPGAVEEYRKLAAALHQVYVARATKVVMVASAGAGEGKTLTAANLALTLSKSFQRRVLLIDTDLRRPMIHDVFGISNTAGLNEGLMADGDAKLPLITVSPKLSVLPAGSPNPDPMGGLTSDRMRRIIEDAATKFEWVVLDTPPVGLLPDAHLLAEMVDMVVLVVSAGKTPLRAVRRAVDALSRKRVVGVVLNRVAASGRTYGYDRYAQPR